jgi:hypothetical protein
MSLVTEANNEIVDAKRSIYLHDVPNNRSPANLNERLRLDHSFFAEPGAQTPGQNDSLHAKSNSFIQPTETRTFSYPADGQVARRWG